jgi:hypothetical protein
MLTKPFSSLMTGCSRALLLATILADTRLVTFEGWAVAGLKVFDSVLRERLVGAIWDLVGNRFEG